MDEITSRESVIADAMTAAARYAETGCDQPPPNLTGSAADLLWREVYAWAIEPAKVTGWCE
jgi:hypothetical protein